MEVKLPVRMQCARGNIQLFPHIRVHLATLEKDCPEAQRLDNSGPATVKFPVKRSYETRRR
ncbi:hypothetical protein J6590_041012 [Homalodisca vitripennis]|nr:hypothetical protein J6590_041012 [Homalodisca vitripennis]